MTPVQRPLSPHLQVYKFQLTSVLSITHRGTGLALTVGAIVLVWWLVALAYGPQSYAVPHAFFASWIGLLFLFGWTFSLFFHLCNGIRHLFWDAGKGFDLKTTYASGWAVVCVSLVLTVLAWAWGCSVVGGV